MKDEIKQNILNMVDDFHSNMDVSEYKNLLLGLFFYKYLSDSLLVKVIEFSDSSLNDYKSIDDVIILYRNLLASDISKDELKKYLINSLGYYIEPDHLSTVLANLVNNECYVSDILDESFSKLSEKYEQLHGLFDDISLQSKRLGSDKKQRSFVVSEILNRLNSISFFDYNTDIIGDLFESLINKFAASLGKKSGEFYTPHMISRLMANIVSLDQEEKKDFTVYDPTMGSASLLLNVRSYLSSSENVRFFGQELNTTTYNLARMNLIIHGVKYEDMYLRNGDTLDIDWPSNCDNTFDSVVMNPPYSAKWSANPSLAHDPRFKVYGKLAPKSKADFAFLLHGYYHLNETGIMAIVLPHGLLFRGASEKAIRKQLIEDGSIHAIIGLPANLFFGTSIPTTIIILKKNRKERDIFFIDASHDYTKEKNQNGLSQNDLNKIISCYTKRMDIEKYSHLASFEEIKENDYNLNIPRYVDTFEEAPPLDILEVRKEIETLQSERRVIEGRIFEGISTINKDAGEKNLWESEILRIINHEQ